MKLSSIWFRFSVSSYSFRLPTINTTLYEYNNTQGIPGKLNEIDKGSGSGFTISDLVPYIK